MSPLQAGRFVHRFAVQDLLDPAAWRCTRANGGSVLVITALTLAAVGLALGSTEIKRARLAEDQLTLCLWVGNPNLTRLETPQVEALDRALAGALNAPRPGGPRLALFEAREGYRKTYPFHVANYQWLVPRSPVGPYMAPFTGRTVVPGDPLPTSRRPKVGRYFATPEELDAVVVTESMLRALGLPADRIPPPLTLEVSGEQEPVRVVGVIDDLPNGQEYLVTEAYHLQLLAKKSVRVKAVESGPVPREWPAPGDLPFEAVKALEDLNLTRDNVSAERRGKGRDVWVLTSPAEEPPTLGDWTRLLETIRDILGKDDRGFADRRQVRAVEIEQRSVPARPPWEMAGVYLSRLDVLPRAAAVIAGKPHNLPVYDDVVKQLVEFDKASGRALVSCLIVSVVLLVNSCANLRVIQELRSELKLGEIGMLKAMGMGQGLLSLVFLYESVLVWATGTALGLALGYGLGALLSWSFIAAKPSEILVGFWCPWYIWLLPLITGPMFSLFAWLGIGAARKAPPIATLRTS